MARPKKAKEPTDDQNYTISDDELKDIMLNDIFNDSNFRITFKDDRLTCMRCWIILSTDRVFKKQYDEMLRMKLAGIEDDIITGSHLKNLGVKVDNLGNVDIAPGYLKLAEMQQKRKQWILEKRNPDYSGRDTNMDNAESVKIVIQMPPKDIEQK